MKTKRKSKKKNKKKNQKKNKKEITEKERHAVGGFVVDGRFLHIELSHGIASFHPIHTASIEGKIILDGS
jgi:hypothetical protein